MNRCIWPLISVALFGFGCSKSDPGQALNTEWHVEPVTPDRVSWRGSYQNAIDSLRVQSHSWKVIGPDTKAGRYLWGFQADIEFPKQPKPKSDAPKRPWDNDPLFMSVSSIEYQIFDADNFLIGTLVLDVDSDKTEGLFNGRKQELGVVEGETKKFQLTGSLSKSEAERAAYGKIRIQAGYQPVPSTSSATPASTK